MCVVCLDAEVSSGYVHNSSSVWVAERRRAITVRSLMRMRYVRTTTPALSHMSATCASIRARLFTLIPPGCPVIRNHRIFACTCVLIQQRLI
jgi:hypothetical protein